MTSVCVFSAAWRRFDVTRLALAQRQRLHVELAARGLKAHTLIVADDENLEIAREYGCETLEAPNAPLGAKCNTGLREAAQQADWVVWIGSDDWIHPDAFAPLLEERESSRLPIHVGETVAAVDLPRGVLQIVAAAKYGAPPWIIDSRLLHAKRQDQPIKPWINRGLDGELVRGIRLARIPFEFVRHHPHDFRCVDFKTDVNLTPFRGVAKHLGIGDEHPAWEALADWYPADLVDQARTTQAVYA